MRGCEFGLHVAGDTSAIAFYIIVTATSAREPVLLGE
jgi:hypothetical protein